MKPTAIFFVLVLLLALLAAPGVRAAEIDGFRGMRWGSNLADLQQSKKLTLTKEGGKSGASLYALENDNLRFGKATLTSINYSFAKERLQGAILLFSGAKNFTAVKAEAMAKYGDSKKIDQNGEEMYNWPGAATSIILSYNQHSQSGFLFIKAQKMPPPTKTAAPKPTTPAPPPAGPQSPRPPARPAVIPSPRPADLETALDRAPPLPPPRQANSAQSFTPEMQALIGRDQALTQLCWETVGPAADAACEQMQDNAERLKAMGLCMQPGSADPSAGAAVIWRRCEPAAAAPPAPNAPGPDQMPLPVGPVPPDQSSRPTAPQPGPEPAGQCRLIGELFAAAAQMRDAGTEPQVAEQELAWRVSSQTPEITIERIRETIELVYFDQEYDTIGGDALIQRVVARCQSGRGPFGHP